MAVPLLPLLLASALADGTRGVFPSDVPVQDVAPASAQTFSDAEKTTTGAYGVRVEMEVSRDGGAFRTVPLSTPLCTFDGVAGKGDHVALRFTPTAAGYIHILSQAADGTWTLIYPAPDRAWEDHAFAPDRPARFPTMEGWGFPVEGSPGPEMLTVILSPLPFSSEIRRFEDHLSGKGAPASRVSVGRLRALGAAQAVYVVGQGEQVLSLELVHVADCGALP